MRSWLPFVLLTVLSWGTYIPTLDKGQLALGGSGLHAFLMVGVAYVLVENQDFASKCNMEMFELETVKNVDDIVELRKLITEHFENTQSDVAEALLIDWESSLSRFVKVMPVDYKQMQGYMSAARGTGKFKTEYDVAVKAFDMHLENLAAEQA